MPCTVETQANPLLLLPTEEEEKKEESGESDTSEDEAPAAPVGSAAPREKLAIKLDPMKLANQYEHHTNDFDNDIFAVRRGQEFSIKVVVNREDFMPKQDRFVLVFTIGKLLM